MRKAIFSRLNTRKKENIAKQKEKSRENSNQLEFFFALALTKKKFEGENINRENFATFSERHKFWLSREPQEIKSSQNV